MARPFGHYSSVEDVLTTCQDVLGVAREVLTRRIKNSPVRPIVAFALCQYAGCTQRAAADVLGLSSGAAVSIQLKKLHDQLKSDKVLQATLKQMKQRLNFRSP